MITFISWLLVTFGAYGVVCGLGLVLFSLLWILWNALFGVKSAEDWANEYDRKPW